MEHRQHEHAEGYADLFREYPPHCRSWKARNSRAAFRRGAPQVNETMREMRSTMDAMKKSQTEATVKPVWSASSADAKDRDAAMLEVFKDLKQTHTPAPHGTVQLKAGEKSGLQHLPGRQRRTHFTVGY